MNKTSSTLARVLYTQVHSNFRLVWKQAARAASILLCAALLIVSPGLDAYQAAAQSTDFTAASGKLLEGPVRSVGVDPVLSFNSGPASQMPLVGSVDGGAAARPGWLNRIARVAGGFRPRSFQVDSSATPRRFLSLKSSFAPGFFKKMFLGLRPQPVSNPTRRAASETRPAVGDQLARLADESEKLRSADSHLSLDQTRARADFSSPYADKPDIDATVEPGEAQTLQTVPAHLQNFSVGDNVKDKLFIESPPPSNFLPPASSGSPDSRRFVRWFLVGLLAAQLGIEVLGVAMPLLMKERFGGFSAVAGIAVFSSAANVIGKFIGGSISEKAGPKATYITATALQLVSISTMILFLLGPAFLPGLSAKIGFSFLAALAEKLSGFYAMKPLSALIGFYSLKGLMGGVSSTAEKTLPVAILGSDRAGLEKFFSLQQWLLEIIGFAGPKVGGKLVRSFGFISALVLYPAAYIIALFMFILGIRLPVKTDASSQASSADSRSSSERKKVGLFRSLGVGIASVLKNPLMRIIFLGYAAFSLLNPLLYLILGPAFGLYVAHGNVIVAADVSSWVTALYSLGGLVGSIVMWRESFVISAAQEGSQPGNEAGVDSAKGRIKKPLGWIINGIDRILLAAYLRRWLAAERKGEQLTGEEGKKILTRSTLLWMRLATFSLAAFAALLVPFPFVTYLAIIPFGIAQVIAVNKLYVYATTKAPSEDATQVIAFVGAASTLVAVLSLKFVGKLFDHFQGVIPFVCFNGLLILLGLASLWLTRALRRHAVETAPK